MALTDFRVYYNHSLDLASFGLGYRGAFGLPLVVSTVVYSRYVSLLFVFGLGFAFFVDLRWSLLSRCCLLTLIAPTECGVCLLAVTPLILWRSTSSCFRAALDLRRVYCC